MRLYVFLFLACCCSHFLYAQTQRAQELRQNVVSIAAKGQNGFGFITGERNGKLFIATAAHVVEDALEADQNVTIKFFEDYNTYEAKILRNYLDVDVALLEVDKPSGFSWTKNCLGVATTNTDVAFIGREESWYVPTDRALGTIYSQQNNRIEADIASVMVGTSGAPLIVESGIVGMIIQTDGIKTLAVDLSQLRAVLSEFDYFFALTGAGLNIPDSTDDLDTDAIYKDIRAYKAAQQKDDIPAYQTYIRDFPSGEFKDKAIGRIQVLEKEKTELQENARWEVARLRDDVPGYQKYLATYPNGKYVQQARQRIQALEKKPTVTSNQLIDKNGNQYRTKVMKDGKRWMIQNLNLQVDDSWCYDNVPANCTKYGRLYTWEAAKEACAELGNGWRLPTDKEWREMAKKYGGADDDASDRGKAAYQALIDGGSSGFAAQLGGWRLRGGGFDSAGTNGYYWSSSPSGSSIAWYYYFYRGNGQLYRYYSTRDHGHSVRCLQD